MRALLGCLLLIACDKTREVSLQLGPTPGTLTAGFTCRTPGGTALIERALVAPDLFELSLVVDLIDLGGKFPGCRGEELLASCNTSARPCSLVKNADGSRYCQTLRFTRDEAMDTKVLLARIREQLSSNVVTSDAPDQAVLIRAVVTAQPCNQIADMFEKLALVGCAYSCPVQLDAIDGPVALSLDTLDSDCQREVETCAGFR